MSRIWALPYEKVIPVLSMHMFGVKNDLRNFIPGHILCGFEGHQGVIAFYEYIENNAPFNQALCTAFINSCRTNGIAFLVQQGSIGRVVVNAAPAVILSHSYPANSAMGKQKLATPYIELQLSETLMQRIYRELEEGSPSNPGGRWADLFRSLSDAGQPSTDVIITQIQKRGQCGNRAMDIIRQLAMMPGSKHTVGRVADAFMSIGMLEVANEIRAKVGVEPYSKETIPGVPNAAVLEQEKCNGCMRYSILSLILGCGHQMCSNCTELLKCPTCGQAITSKISI